MKIRSDFVSNSSSCSFIVRSSNDTSLLGIADDNKLLAALSAVKSIELCAGKWAYDSSYTENDNDSERFDTSTVFMCKSSKLFRKVNDRRMTLKNNLKFNDILSEIAILREVLKQTTEIMLDFGLDDCGEFTGLAAQIGMLFEMAGFEVDDSIGETSYPSVKNWLLRNN